MQTINPKYNCQSIQKVFLHSVNILKEDKYFLEHRIVVSSAINDKLRKKYHFFENSEVDEKNSNNGFQQKFSQNQLTYVL